MTPARSFEDVEVWKKSHNFVLNVYRFTETFPKTELFGLVSQLRRAAVSLPANIAEGFKRIGKADKLRFYNIAQASLGRMPLLSDFIERSKLRRCERFEKYSRRGQQDARWIYASDQK